MQIILQTLLLCYPDVIKQADLAKVLRVAQPRVSDLLRGRIDLFSTDTPIDMLAPLGVRVRLVLKPGRRGLKVAEEESPLTPIFPYS